MSDNKVTLDQLDNSAVEAMTKSVGDVSMLNTENKTIVGALAEIVGKKEIANAIGEPLAETDKFTEMSSEINGLLSTFKTNMMNAGVVVESGDKFKALIDKIQGLTEGEGNKGMRFVSGNATDGVLKTHTHTYTNSEGEEVTNSNKMFDIEIELDFDPSIILVFSKFTLTTIGLPTDMQSITIYDNLEKNKINFGEYSSDNSSDYANSFILPPLVEEDKHYLPIAYPGLTTIQKVTVNQCTWYAIGVGEEDTTLRDSLADILENKGVDVTEEDDMASLITKVDSISGGLDIISATELPATGRENQICVITDTTPESYLLTSNINDKSVDTNKITIYVSNSSSYDTVTGTLVPITNGIVTTNYYFNKICQGENRLSSYIYKNNNWQQLTQACIQLLENGTYVNKNYFGGFSTGGKIHYYEGEAITVDHINTSWYTTIGASINPIDMTLYNKVRCLAYVNPTASTTTPNATLYLSLHKQEFGYTDYGSSYNISAGSTTGIDALGNFTVTQLPIQEFIFDVSDYTGEYYLGIGGKVNYNNGHLFITDISIY